MSSPLADYYRPLSAAPDDEAGNRPPSIEDRPASAQGSAGIKSNVPRRPKSVPPGGATGRLLREIQKSRSAVYSLDVDDEPLPPGRDPTLLGKHPDDDGGTTCQQPRWISTRNRGGIVRSMLARRYATHVAGRYAGRDRDSGFRSPYGVDYVPVGGEVSIMSGENIRDGIAGGWKSSMRAQASAQLPPKTALELDHTVEYKATNYKFKYFLLDLSDRPLEHAPKKIALITFSMLLGSGEAYAAMEGEHAYPTDEAYTWKFDLESEGQLDQANVDTRKQSATITIKPSDVPYAAARKKKIVLAVRSEMGDLQYRIKATTASFISGGVIESMLSSRSSKRDERQARLRETQDYRDCISQSAMRIKFAMAGKMPPESQERPSSAFDVEAMSPALENSMTATTVVEDLPVKKKSFASTLDSNLSAWEANPAEFLKQLRAEELAATRAQEQAAAVVNAGGTTQRGAGTTTARSTMKSARSARSVGSMSSRSVYSARSMASSMAGSLRSKKSVRDSAVPVDEDIQALERGEWSKLVLKARVPAAMRLEWAAQELEVKKGKRTGETGMRRYIKMIPRDVRKRDQAANLSEVMVKATSALGSGPIMTPELLQQLYGKEYRAGEFYILSQQSGQDIPPDQPRVPSLKLESFDDDSTPQQAKDHHDGRLQSARDHKPEGLKDVKNSASDAPGSFRGSSGGGAGAGEGKAKVGSESGGPSSGRRHSDGGGGNSSARGGQSSARGSQIASLTGSLTSRSISTSSIDGDQGGLFSDDEKLAVALFELKKQQYDTKYSRTTEFLDKLEEGQPTGEVGVNLPTMIQLLMDMKIVSTSKSSAIGKRDVNSIGREIFHERALDHHPSDEEIVLSYPEFKVVLEKISLLLGKPYYADRPRPKGIDKELWRRLKEDINPSNRLKRISKQENFRRQILRSFGRYNKKNDGKLTRDEFVELCKNELGFTKNQSFSLLEPAGVNVFNLKHFDLETFSSIFIADEEPVQDIRDTDETRGKALDLHYLLQNVRNAVGTMSADTLKDDLDSIEKFQEGVRERSEPESKSIEKTGWIYRQETDRGAQLWRMYFAVVESHVGGTVIRLFPSPITRLGHSKAELESLGQVDEMWVDGSDPVEIVLVNDDAREEAKKTAKARGQDHRPSRGSAVTSEDSQLEAGVEGDWGQCIIKVACRALNREGEKKTVSIKVRGALVEDEAQDWAQAIRQGVQKRQLWGGDALKDVQPIAKSSEDLRSACASTISEDPMDSLLVKDITTLLLEGLRASSIIQPTFDRDGVISLAKSKQEADEEDKDKGKKKKFKVMDSIKEETDSALRAFLTTRRDSQRSSST